jgi:hypothetical protein
VTNGVVGATSRPAAWQHLRAFNVQDWLDLVEASLTLAWSHAALHTMSPSRVIGRATRSQARVTRPASAARLARVAWLVGVAGRHIVRVSCLSRSVALARVLGRRGAPAAVRIGVRTVSGRLEAHAWVVLNGRVINDDEAAVTQYAVFDRPLADLASARPDFR